MELRRLRYLVALAAEENFTRAAAQLHIAQPALSQQIKALERELGVTLVDRTNRGVRLTEAGRVARVEAEQLLAHADRARERIRAAATTPALRFAHTRSYPAGKAAALLTEFRRRAPEVELEVHTGWTARNLTELHHGRLDAAIVRPPVADADLDLVPLDREEIVLAVPEADPLASGRRVHRAQLAGKPVVLWPRANGPGMYDHIVEQIWPDRPPEVVRWEPDDEQLLHAVGAGVGVAPVPRDRARALRVRGVRLRRLTAPTPVVEVGLVSRADANSPGLPMLRALARELAAAN